MDAHGNSWAHRINFLTRGYLAVLNQISFHHDFIIIQFAQNPKNKWRKKIGKHLIFSHTIFQWHCHGLFFFCSISRPGLRIPELCRKRYQSSTASGTARNRHHCNEWGQYGTEICSYPIALKLDLLYVSGDGKKKEDLAVDFNIFVTTRCGIWHCMSIPCCLCSKLMLLESIAMNLNRSSKGFQATNSETLEYQKIHDARKYQKMDLSISFQPGVRTKSRDWEI